MCRFEVDRGGAAVFERVFPAGDADTPFVTGFQSRKSPLWDWCHEIVAIKNREIEEFPSDLYANGVLADVFRARAAIPVSIETRQWIAAATF